MSNANIEPEELSPEEQVLAYTQGKRKKLVEVMTENNTMPADKGDRMVLLAALSDMDKVSLTKMKIKSEDKNAILAGKSSQAIAELLSKVVPKQFQHKAIPESVFPVLSDDLPPIELVDGETTLGTQSGNYESFNKKFEDSQVGN
jgi:hypothetical protein